MQCEMEFTTGFENITSGEIDTIAHRVFKRHANRPSRMLVVHSREKNTTISQTCHLLLIITTIQNYMEQ